MTIRELLEASPNCDTIEAVIRKNGCGQWLQGYRVGKDVRLYPSEQSREFIEMMSLNEYGTKSYKLSVHGFSLTSPLIPWVLTI